MRVRQIAASAGEPCIIENELAPLPAGHIRVRTQFSGVSAGTEMLMLNSHKDPNAPPLPLGYQLAGQVDEIAPDLGGQFRAGETVACYGGPYVCHSSFVNVPRHLVARVPAAVEPEHAALCALGTIALHAFRMGGLCLGETAAVLGLGMLGNFVAQIARAAGCRVAAADLADKRRRMAAACGIDAVDNQETLLRHVQTLSDNHGADAVFISVNNCNDQTLADAVSLVRQRGQIVVVGTASAALPREALFHKEASIVVSRAGGPGRYDRKYEAGGHDYPYPFARWTEGRNLEEFIRLLAAGSVNAKALVTDMIPVADMATAYRWLRDDPASHMGIVFDWRD
jgi:2-desacetyl-2-hydroxyethyl bacteriochlorophyllide A dehydrogenase